MTALKTYQQIIAEGLDRLPVDRSPATLYHPIRYTLDLGGKRMRPVLVLMAAEMVGGQVHEALPAAIGIELFHNFTLLHDDIMDEAPLRRGAPTVYKKYNANTAILSGDVMFTIACQQVAKVPPQVLQPVLSRFHQTAIEVCEGQQLDLDFESLAEVTIADYLEMIRLKTAVLLGASLEIGGRIGGADEATARALYTIGEHLGLAFQLQDDILDTYGDVGKFGKQVGGDIVQNKKTFLLLTARASAGREQREALDYWCRQSPADSTPKIEAVKALFDALGVPEKAAAERDRHYRSAIAALEDLPVPEEAKHPLVSLAAQLLQREQ